MKLTTNLPLAALVLACGAACQTTTHESMSSDTPGKAPSPQDQQEMMKKMMELATPSAEHMELVKMTGAWTQHYKMRWAPDAPWQGSTGTSTIKSILGGRYVQEDVSATMEGMPFQGMQLLGYDKLTNEYISLWMDSMCTWWMESRGKKDAKGVIDMHGMMSDVAGTRPFRMVVHHIDGSSSHVEMFDTKPNGEELVMTIDAKRVEGKQ